jgi:hypothetical protein
MRKRGARDRAGPTEEDARGDRSREKIGSTPSSVSLQGIDARRARVASTLSFVPEKKKYWQDESADR